MSKPAARVGDMHGCSQVTGTVPHVGGPISKGAGTVIIEGRPSARVGDTVNCAVGVDTIATCSATVIVENLPAARLGDSTAHAGVIVQGAPTGLIGD